MPARRKPQAKVPTEAAEMRLFTKYMAQKHPDLLWCHVPNERSNAITARQLSMQGVKAGVPDCLIFETRPGKLRYGLAIEMKRRNAAPSAVSERQRWWLAQLEARDWEVSVCRGAVEAAATVEAYLARFD